jgi:hypothetical protein
MRQGTFRNAGSVLCLLFLGVTTSAEAVCTARVQVAGETRQYHYVASVVETLGRARLAEQRWLQAFTAVDNESRGAQRLDDLLQSVAKLSHSVSLVMQDYDCSAALLRPFLEDDEKPIRVTAAEAHEAYLSLSAASRQFLEGYVRALDTLPQQPFASMSAVGALGADLKAKKSAAGSKLFDATAFRAGATLLIPPEASGGNPRWSVGPDQRKRLRDELQKQFGPVVTRGISEAQTYVSGAAAGLYGMLSWDPPE